MFLGTPVWADWAPSQTNSLFWKSSLWSWGAGPSQEQRGNRTLLQLCFVSGPRLSDAPGSAGRTAPETIPHRAHAPSGLRVLDLALRGPRCPLAGVLFL